MVAMRNALLKDSFREIKRTLSRFISIFAIVALGTGFFAGIKATSPDMWHTADEYFDNTRLEDIRLVSTLGFDENDLQAIRSTEGVEGTMPSYTVDVLDRSKVLRLHSIQLGATDDDNNLNKPVLLEGRLPQKSGECVTEAPHGTKKGFHIGDTISVTAGGDSPIADSLKTTSFKVVGIVMSPYYLAYDRGTTSIGSGTVDTFLLIPDVDFNLPVYTDVFIAVDGARQQLSYSDEYNAAISTEKDRFKAVAEVREPQRYEGLVSQAQTELNNAKAKLADGKKSADEELLAARTKLDDAKAKLVNGTIEYNKNKKDFEIKINDAQKQLDDGYTAYNKGIWDYSFALSDFLKAQKKAYEQFKDAEAQIAAGQAEYEAGLAQYNSGKALYDVLSSALDAGNTPEAIATINQLIPSLEAVSPDLAAVLSAYTAAPDNPTNAAMAKAAAGQFGQMLEESKEKLDAAKAVLASGRAKISEGHAMLSAGQAKLDVAKQELDDAKSTLDENSEKLKEARSDGNKQLADAVIKLKNGEQELADGESEYLKAKTEADQKIADAQAKIDDGEKQLAAIKPPKWYILDRDSIPGNSGYYDDTQRINAISKVFPVFFLLVAALVCLTTMTRMVEEQRTEVGTIKALGYGKASIAFKFFLYSILASLLGSIGGLAIGFKLFPWVIGSAYGILYNMPAIQTPFLWGSAIATTLVAVLCTSLTALFACYKELMEQPSALMRPKAPKPGKRVLLERIPFIWNRLSFIQKVTVRNLLRYKRRILMTVLGIAGCTALMLTGFGLKNSITDIVGKQFGEIFKYDAAVLVDEKAASAEKDNFYSLAGNEANIQHSKNVRQNSITVTSGKTSQGQDATLFVPETTEGVDEFILLRSRQTHAPITMSDDGVVITEKLSMLLNVGAGDTITLLDSDNHTADVKITGVAENYAHHYVYLTCELYETLFATPFVPNTLFCTLSDNSPEAEEVLSQILLKNSYVLNVSFSSSIKKSFTDVLGSMNYVILVLIFSAGALAFIVLYNLTNINVTERIREIATIKVLGFYDREVSAYIYRENIALTLMGIVCGLVGGVFLHKFVIEAAEIDMVMFGRDIGAFAFIMASVLTLLFALLVNVVLHFRLKKISMVESLKSIE